MPPLTPVEAADLQRHTPGWSLHDDARRMERAYRFKTFAESLAFVERVAAIAEAQNHHPDISFGWGYATLSLQTHAIDGLTRSDFVLAAKIDGLGPA